ncbi:cytochrome P450 [Pseudonocardia nematodicida]|uniref:Cytochrome P450 n=1 Tax=Pseudonocardia nematodicida TaxID=1206997 RepID=A0ABV1K5I8_9PSEU
MTEAAGTPFPGRRFRLVEPEVAKDPGAYFDTLRSTCPVARSTDFGGFWVLSTHSDVHEACLAPEVFSSAGPINIPAIPQPPVICIEQDDPEHRKYRKPMQGWFSAKRVQGLEDQVRTIVADCIDRVLADGEGDLGAILAAPVPPTVIALVLGLPEQDWEWFRERETTLIAHAQVGDSEAAAPVYREIADYLSAHIGDRRTAPRADMLTDIAQLTIDGSPVPHEDAVGLAFLILGAGHETTVGGIGGMLYQVLKDTRVRDQLVADPSRAEIAVEEALRLEAPLLGLARTLAGTATMRGVDMSEGDRVMLLFGAANRDDAVFESPEDFRLDRTNVQKHLAFGAGVHRCVGAPLARLEMRIVLEEVLTRMPGVRLTDPDSVSVRWTVGREFSNLHASW